MTSKKQPKGLNLIIIIKNIIVQIPSSWVVPCQVRLSESLWPPASHDRQYKPFSQGAFHVCLQETHSVLSSSCGFLLCCWILSRLLVASYRNSTLKCNPKGTVLENSYDCWRGVAWSWGELELLGFLYLCMSIFISLLSLTLTHTLCISLAPSFLSLWVSFVSSDQISPHVKKWLLVRSMPCTPQFNQQRGPTLLPLILGPKLSGKASVWPSAGLSSMINLYLKYRVGDGQGSRACCSNGVTKNWTQLSNWTELHRGIATTMRWVYHESKNTCYHGVGIIISSPPKNHTVGERIGITILKKGQLLLEDEWGARQT